MGTPSRLWFLCGGPVRRPGTDSAIGSLTARGGGFSRRPFDAAQGRFAETQRCTIRVVTTESPLWAIAQNALSAFLLSSQRLCVLRRRSAQASARERLSHDSRSEPRDNRSQVSALARGQPPAECCIEASRSVSGNDSTTGSGYPLKTRKRQNL